MITHSAALCFVCQRSNNHENQATDASFAKSAREWAPPADSSPLIGAKALENASYLYNFTRFGVERLT